MHSIILEATGSLCTLSIGTSPQPGPTTAYNHHRLRGRRRWSSIRMGATRRLGPQDSLRVPQERRCKLEPPLVVKFAVGLQLHSYHRLVRVREGASPVGFAVCQSHLRFPHDIEDGFAIQVLDPQDAQLEIKLAQVPPPQTRASCARSSIGRCTAPSWREWTSAYCMGRLIKNMESCLPH